MSGLLGFATIFLVISPALSFPEKDVSNVEPEYLNMLLNTNQYELFSKLMKIDDVNLVRPTEGARSTHPMFNEGLEFGDVIMPKKHKEEEARQSIRFEEWRDTKWENRRVPYVIHDKYTEDQKNVILNAINHWNEKVACLKFVPRTNEDAYVLIFDGSGCWSFLGRAGFSQPLSLEANSCLNRGTILHQMGHTVGRINELNREDRDDYIKIRWHNIPDHLHHFYERFSDHFWKIVGPYDFYSVMNYPMILPENRKQAFEVKSRGVQTWRIGHGQQLTALDVDKINAQYC